MPSQLRRRSLSTVPMSPGHSKLSVWHSPRWRPGEGRFLKIVSDNAARCLKTEQRLVEYGRASSRPGAFRM
ncbi:MAG: hypothetical protein MZV64_30445 [Ignavibacteriales bacterium]|nr:hypothetical protein [Ignavibacteriales bacterium]